MYKLNLSFGGVLLCDGSVPVCFDSTHSSAARYLEQNGGLASGAQHTTRKAFLFVLHTLPFKSPPILEERRD